MPKKMLTIIVSTMILIVIISLYATFAYNEEASKLENSKANYNLVYSLKDKNSKTINVSAKEDKFIDITLNNTYDYTVKYGIYYSLITPNRLPENVKISISNDSVDLSQDNIKPHEDRTITVRIENSSEYNVELLVGALIGFENGKISELLNSNEVLIK